MQRFKLSEPRRLPMRQASPANTSGGDAGGDFCRELLPMRYRSLIAGLGLSFTLQANALAITDVSQLLTEIHSAELQPIKVDELKPAIGQQILATKALAYGDTALFSVNEQPDEPQRLAQNPQLKRNHKALIIKGPKQFWTLSDWQLNSGDGDSQHYRYDRLLTADYLKIDVFYGQDAPGSLLINHQTGTALNVHTANDIVAPSPDNRQLLVANDGLNPPLGLMLFSLGRDGHRLELQCQSLRQYSSPIRQTFHGWHSTSKGFDLVLSVGQQSQAIRFDYRQSGWQMATTDPAWLQQPLLGFQCWQRQ